MTKPTKVGFTGTQRGLTDLQKRAIRRTLQILKPAEVHLGDCVGADEEVRQIAVELKIQTVGHPPTEERKRAFGAFSTTKLPKPYLDRNRDIVDESDLLIAGPREYTNQTRSGTWYTYRYARQKGKRTVLIWPDGTRGDMMNPINTTRRNN